MDEAGGLRRVGRCRRCRARAVSFGLPEVNTDGTLQTTTYASYVGLDAMYGVARPPIITQKIQTPDGDHYCNHVQSITYTRYNDAGNVDYSVVVLGPVDDGHYAAEGTAQVYSAPNGNIPAGLVTQTKSIFISISIPEDGSMPALGDAEYVDVLTENTLTQNVYYGIDEYNSEVPGSLYGALKYSIDAAGQETYYAYDATGHTVHQYMNKTWTEWRSGMTALRPRRSAR